MVRQHQRGGDQQRHVEDAARAAGEEDLEADENEGHGETEEHDGEPPALLEVLLGGVGLVEVRAVHPIELGGDGEIGLHQLVRRVVGRERGARVARLQPGARVAHGLEEATEILVQGEEQRPLLVAEGDVLGGGEQPADQLVPAGLELLVRGVTLRRRSGQLHGGERIELGQLGAHGVGGDDVRRGLVAQEADRLGAGATAWRKVWGEEGRRQEHHQADAEPDSLRRALRGGRCGRSS